MDQYQKEHLFAGAVIAVGMICGSIALMKLGIIGAVWGSRSSVGLIILLVGTTVVCGGLITLGSAIWGRARKLTMESGHLRDEMGKERPHRAPA
jgi:hypothetical protein